MKSKILIIGAALVAAGVNSSQALTPVYATNVVGYVNVTITNGYNLISLPLQSPDPTSSINSVLTNTQPVMPFGAYMLPWQPASASFGQAVYAGGDGNWYDPTISFEETNSLPPGTGFFLFLPNPGEGGYSSLNVLVTGSVLQGTNSIYENVGYGFFGNFEPVAGDITTNGFLITETGSYLYTWNPATQSYNSAVYGVDATDNSPNPEQFFDPTYTYVVVVAPPVASAFIYYNLGVGANWTQTFEVE